MVFNLDDVVKQLIVSGVLSVDQLKPYVPPKANPGSLEDLVGDLVEHAQLTRFQAQTISAGQTHLLQLGGYTLLDRIGSGGMGQVYRALHRRMDRVVAIKTLPDSTMKDEIAVARFNREVRAAAKLRHPNIVAADDADEFRGIHFLVMECIDGIDLKVRVRKQGTLSIGDCMDCILQAARGLEYAHSQGVVHRDIKPSNLLWDRKGTVKILDMGLARMTANYDPAHHADLTGTGTVVGTVDYMAPEQAEDSKSVDARADMYSLGCTLFFLLTGQSVYEGDTMVHRIMAHREHPIPSLSEFRDDVPAEVESVFRRMVAKQPDDRPQSMTTLIKELIAIQPAVKRAESRANRSATLHLESDLNDCSMSESLATKSTVFLNREKARPQNWPGHLISGACLIAVLAIGWYSSRPKSDAKMSSPIASQVPSEEPATQAVAVVEPMTPDPAKPELSASSPSMIASPADSQFADWVGRVKSLPANQQIEEVRKKLMDLNPKFDGKLDSEKGDQESMIVDGEVSNVRFLTDHVLNIAPLQGFPALKVLRICGGQSGTGAIADLSPLRGMHLERLYIENNPGINDLSPLSRMRLDQLGCFGTNVTDLAPLRGMPLTWLGLGGTPVTSLEPLSGMPLVELQLYGARVSDLSPLRGMKYLNRLWLSGTGVADLKPLAGLPLESLFLDYTPVTDLKPLQGMKLKAISFNPNADMRGYEALRSMDTLEHVSFGNSVEFTAAEFWKKLDAGDFKQ